jgi:hypothetical protein
MPRWMMNTRIRLRLGSWLWIESLPVAAFEKDIVQNGGKSAIQINITGVGGTEISQSEPTTINQTTIDGDSGEILQD